MLRKFLLIIAMIFLVTGCSLNNKEEYVIQPSDNAFILKKNMSYTEYEPQDIYVKYDGQEIQKAISQGVPDYKYIYGKESMLVQNQNNELIKVDKNGNQEIIANNMNEYMVDIEVSKDGEVIVFTNNDWNLYIKRCNEEKIKIDDNVEFFYISDDAKYVYYEDGYGDFYVYDGTNSEHIGENISEHRISNNGKNVVFVEYGNRLCLKLGNKKEVDEIISSDAEIRQSNVYDDGSVSYIKLKNIGDEFGELHTYTNGNKQMIARVVEEYFKKGEIIYYIDGKKNLYQRNIKEDESVQLLSNVIEFKETRDGIVVVDKSGQIYIKDNKSKLIKIGTTDNIEDEFYIGIINIVNENDVVYTNKNNSLYVNDKKISDNVLSHACNSQNVAYVTDERKVYVYNTKKESSKLEIDNLTGYTDIFFEDQYLYYNKLEISDLVGFWKVSEKDNVDSQDFLVEFRRPNIILKYYQNGERYYDVFELYESYVDYIGLDTDSGSFIEIRKDENEQYKLYFDDVEYLCKRVNKEEANDIIKLGIENHKALNSEDEIESTIEEDIDEYEYDLIDCLLKDYIEDYVYAVNENDFENIVSYLVYEGPLYNKHSKNVTEFYEKGISEKLYSSEITEIKKNDSGDFQVKTLEKIGVIKDGEEQIKSFEPVYLIKEIDGEYLIYEMN